MTVQGRIQPDHQLFLDPRCNIKVRDGIPWLSRGSDAPPHKLPLGMAIGLELLAGFGDRAAALRNWPGFLGNGTNWIDAAIDRYWSYLDGKAARPIDFDWLGDVDVDRCKARSDREADSAPHALVWLTTLACNRACPFCFYDVASWTKGNPEDAIWSLDAIKRTLDEMHLVGASHLYLTGGEPFLRADLLSIFEAAAERRVRPHIATRIKIDTNMAECLARIEWGSFTYSLDAGTQKIADALAGRTGFFTEAKASLKNLVNAGVPVVVNAVATRTNIGKFEALAELLCEVGVFELEISRYVPPVTERKAAQALIPNDGGIRLEDEVAQLAELYGGRLCISMGASGAVPTNTEYGKQNVCEVGFSELHILPDGSATRCRYLPREPALIVGNLEKQSLQEVWTGKALSFLNAPERETYSDSACGGCGSFSGCNKRGRCYVSALAATKSMFAPDQFCDVK